MSTSITEIPQNCRHFLPIEIWGIILNTLSCHPRAIISASNVCSEWRHLVTQICKKVCINHLDERLINELAEINVTHQERRLFKENVHPESIDWIKVYWLYHETLINVDNQKNIIPLQLESVTSITNEDPYLVITTYNKIEDRTKFIVLNSEDFSFFENFVPEKSIESLLKSLDCLLSFYVEGQVYQTCFLYIPRPIIMLASSLDLRAVIFEGRGNDRSNFQIVFTNPRMKGNTRISGDGKYLLTVDSQIPNSLLLYKVISVDEELNLDILHRLQSSGMPYQFALSKSLIHTMEPTGHIKSYKVKGLPEDSNSPEEVDSIVLCAQSDLKKDLRYPNPTIFVKDFVFSSTLISRNLLWYWHMDRGRDYWIIGDVSQPAGTVINNTSPSDVSCIRLYQVYIGRETGFTVTTMQFQRGILLCGTREGHLLGYKLKKNRVGTSDNDFEDCSKVPWLLVKGVISQSISRLGCLFTPLGLLVAAANGGGSCSVVYIPNENIS